MRFTRRDFPEGVLLGAAISACQVEGQASGDGSTPRDTFAATPGNVVSAEPSHALQRALAR